MKKVLFILFLIYPFCLKGQDITITDYNGGGTLYLGGTILFSAINSTTTYFNIKKLNKYDKYRSNAIFGAISGGAQTALGIVGFSENNKNAVVPASINIGLGLATLTTSIIRLATKNPPKEKDITWNMIYILGKQNSDSILGLNLKMQFK